MTQQADKFQADKFQADKFQADKFQADEFEVIVYGLVRLDILQRVASLPPLGRAVRILEERKVTGGKAANTAIALSRWSVQAALIGNALGDDAEGKLLWELFARDAPKIDTRFLTISALSLLGRPPLYPLGFGYHIAVRTPFSLHHANVGFIHGLDRGWSLPLLLVYALINPLKEELIARAFVMSEVRFLTGRSWVAVTASVGLQVSYHFYQGIFAALSYIALFLVFALCYSRTRLILPIVLAPLHFDLLALGFI